MLSLFADHPDAPLSIHRFVKHGAESCGKYPGEWFGPSATARCIEYAANTTMTLEQIAYGKIGLFQHNVDFQRPEFTSQMTPQTSTKTDSCVFPAVTRVAYNPHSYS
jgi:hypothetical protein